MKAPPFRYVRPSTQSEACALLADNEDAQILAGGQSLIATLNMRLARPSLLIDINRITDCPGIEAVAGGGFRVGPLVRHAEMARSPIVADRAPLITWAMEHVAHMAIRNRGTHCGSLALADPAAEMPACAVALDARLILARCDGQRSIAAGDYFLGPYDTPRQPDEMLVEVCYPALPVGTQTGFGEIAVRHGDFPQVGIAVTAVIINDVVNNLRLVTFGCEPCARFSTVAADLARGQVFDSRLISRIADAVAEDIEPMESDAVRRLQTRTLIGRVLADLRG